MLILLPPSEGKSAPRRGAVMRPESLSFPELGQARAEVARALAAVSAGEHAAAVLGVPPSVAADIARNTRLDTAPATTAATLYTGVLYDALDLAGLDPAAKRRAARWIVVVSALYGAVRTTDRIAPYRLSMDVTLPDVGRLAAHWRGPLAPVLTQAASRGLVVDCRSATYVAACPAPAAVADRWLEITVPGASHRAKHTRGSVARAICEDALDPRTPEQLAGALTARFAPRLVPPPRPGRPWRLEVAPVG